MTDNSSPGARNSAPLRLGTRRSKLAMAQSGLVAEAVREVTGRAVELVEITTYGDTSREHLAQIGGTGVFVAALREALVRGEVDFAVHSLKDLPTFQPDDLVLAAVPQREDPRDALIARDGLTSSCRSTPSCPLPAREHWRSSAPRPAPTSPPRSPSSTTRTPGSP
ncbi:hypothetical protein ACZ90_18810 [Streptomyces albus subsp. albus]|nr:hypothetical protein ACZ90_18810 [Streptomyces albus subsp. albus]